MAKHEIEEELTARRPLPREREKLLHDAYNEVRERFRAKDETAFDHLWLTMQDLVGAAFTLGQQQGIAQERERRNDDSDRQK